MIHVAADFVEDLPEMRSILDGLQYRKRGVLKRDSYEAWYPEPNNLGAKLGALAAQYARDYLNAVADEPTAILATRYEEGHECIDHIDQYFDRPGARDTGHRTVSVSVIVDQADAGGELVVQDPFRDEPEVVTGVPPGYAVFFPADWWHKVLPIETGIRRSVIQWYADASGKRFRSRTET